MTNASSDIIVAIHGVPRGRYFEQVVYAGRVPFGPRGGRSGNVVDAQWAGGGRRFPTALREAERYVATHPGAVLDLTPWQQQAAHECHQQRAARAAAKAARQAARAAARRAPHA